MLNIKDRTNLSLKTLSEIFGNDSFNGRGFKDGYNTSILGNTKKL